MCGTCTMCTPYNKLYNMVHELTCTHYMSYVYVDIIKLYVCTCTFEGMHTITVYMIDHIDRSTPTQQQLIINNYT